MGNWPISDHGNDKDGKRKGTKFPTIIPTLHTLQTPFHPREKFHPWCYYPEYPEKSLTETKTRYGYQISTWTMHTVNYRYQKTQGTYAYLR